MQGKTVLITGADGDIGRETTRGLAQKGAAVIMACIDKNAAMPLCESVKQESGNQNITVMQINLAKLSSIRKFADSFLKEHQQLHVLINNAGVYCHKRSETMDGFENTIGINYLGPFLLTNLLLPVIQNTPDSRIVNVSSDAHFQDKLDLQDFNTEKKYSGRKAYNRSKGALILFTQELAERLQNSTVTVNALHPGHAATGIWNIWPGTWRQSLITKMINRFMITPEEAALTSIFLATSAEAKGLSGKYFSRTKRKDQGSGMQPREGVWPLSAHSVVKLKEPSLQFRDKALQKALWELSEKLTALA